MNYPFWDVAGIGSGLVIAIIAIFHVMISHFAVGGGLMLPALEHRARRLRREDWLNLLHKNMRFFLIVTGVFGTVSGVGIWFSIGLAQPAGTSALIHTFVFFWAIEWVFFLIELSCAAAYYYSWGRIKEGLHQAVGWIYCISSFITLFVINGILSFMLTPGADWLRSTWMDEVQTTVVSGFFNPSFWPSLLLRFLACIALATVFILLSFSKINVNLEPKLKHDSLTYVVRWLIPVLLLLPLGLLWYLCTIPDSQLSHFWGPPPGLLPILISVVIVSTATAIIAFVFTISNPLHFGPGKAWILLLMAGFVVAATEYSREMLRKPYVICGYMYSNGVRVADVEKFNQEGFLKESLWVNTKSDYGVGEAMFRGQCMSCHTWDGYRSMEKLLANRSRESIQSVLDMLYEYKPEYAFTHYMPPLVGTAAERRALMAWLEMKSGVTPSTPAPQK